MSDFTVLSDSDAVLFQKLKEFYASMVDLALNSEIVVPCDTEGKPGEPVRVIFPYKMGPLLEKVDPNWVKSNDAE